MEADPDFDKNVIGIDGEDVRKAEKELVQYNSKLSKKLCLAVYLFFMTLAVFWCFFLFKISLL